MCYILRDVLLEVYVYIVRRLFVFEDFLACAVGRLASIFACADKTYFARQTRTVVDNGRSSRFPPGWFSSDSSGASFVFLRRESRDNNQDDNHGEDEITLDGPHKIKTCFFIAVTHNNQQ